MEWLGNLFSFDQLWIEQKVVSIAQRYRVFDEQGLVRFTVVRPPHLRHGCLVGMAGMAVNLIFLIAGFRYAMAGGNFAVALGLILVGGWLAVITRMVLAPYRDILVFGGESEESFPVLTIVQENRIGLYHRFLLLDVNGEPVGFLTRNVLKSLWRREWRATNPGGEALFTAREDTLGLSLLRRYFGPLFGILRTNFIFELPDKIPVGRFNRRMTITDQYVMDLTSDPWTLVDRRMALAMGILLDTAEGR